MQYKNTLEAIYIQLNELQQNVASWGAEKQIRNIDVDLALEKLRDTYDLVLSLKAEPDFMQADQNKSFSESSESTPEKIDEPAETIELEVETDTKTQASEVIEKETHQKKETSEKQKTESSEIEKPQKTKEEIIEELTKKSTKPSPSDAKSNLSEKFGHNRPTLNEELSSQVASADLANQLRNRPITNLSSAIGLNEKFEFINNLFHGDKGKYEETIEKLNMATNFNEAYNYLSTTLNWDMSAPSTQRILDLIRRKLIVNNNDK